MGGALKYLYSLLLFLVLLFYEYSWQNCIILQRAKEIIRCTVAIPTELNTIRMCNGQLQFPQQRDSVYRQRRGIVLASTSTVFLFFLALFLFLSDRPTNNQYPIYFCTVCKKDCLCVHYWAQIKFTSFESLVPKQKYYNIKQRNANGKTGAIETSFKILKCLAAYTADFLPTYIHWTDVVKISFQPSTQSRVKHENFINATGLVK